MTNSTDRPTSGSSRPVPDDVATAVDVSDWYWTRQQLDQIARRLGVPRAGSKTEVTQRLIAVLSGQSTSAATPKRATHQLRPPFDAADVIPDGQRMTQQLREYLITQVGPEFRFDRHMRAFFADPGGRTLGDAVRHWQQTRALPPADIEPQFEFNRFTRWFRRANPQAERTELLAAWEGYKATPRSQRPELPR